MGITQYTWKNRNRDIDLEQYVYYIGSYHYNWHNAIELILVLQGEIEVNNNGHNYLLQEDDLMMINSNIGHATLAKKPDSIAMVIHLNPIYFSSYYSDYNLLEFNCISQSRTRHNEPFKKIRTLALEMIQVIGNKTPSEKIYFESLLHQLIAALVHFFPPKEISTKELVNNKKKTQTVNRMIQYINNHYKDKISLEDLSKLFGYHKSYISQIVKQQIGINYYEYLTRIRLREATYALVNLDEKVSDIALSYGFSEVKSFNKVFKSSFGKTPSQYRNQLLFEKTSKDHLRKKRYLEKEELEKVLKRKKAIKTFKLPEQSKVNQKGREGITEEERDTLITIKKLLHDSLAKIIHIENKI